jgi:Flp pilus assembly protein TadG
MADRCKSIYRLKAKFRRLPACERGASIIEFSLVFPILVVLFLGLVEFGEAFSIDRRMAHTATTVADLVAQVKTVDTADLTDIKLVADEILKPHPNTTFGLVITSVYTDEYDVTRVEWSYAAGSGVSAHAAGSTFTLPTGLAETEYGMIVVETKYAFTPTVGLLLLGTHNLDGHAYARPRKGSKVIKSD